MTSENYGGVIEVLQEELNREMWFNWELTTPCQFCKFDRKDGLRKR